MPRIKASNLAEHQVQARAALAQALDDCLSRKPYEAISLADIATAAGMARNTIYNYAADKPALVADVTDYVASAMLRELGTIAATRSPPPERLAALVTTLMTWVATGRHRAVIAHAISRSWAEEPAAPLGSKVAATIFQVAAEGAASGLFRRDFELPLELLSGTAKVAAERIFLHPEELTRVSREATRLLLAGLMPRHPSQEFRGTGRS